MTQSLVQWEVERPYTRVITNNSICNREKYKAWEKEESEPTHTGKKATNRKRPWGDQILDLVDRDFK